MQIKSDKNLLKKFSIASVILVLLIILLINFIRMPQSQKSTLDMGAVELNVKDLERVNYFYKDLVGLQELRREENLIVLGDEKNELVRLYSNSQLNYAPKSEAGLYHMAIVYPTRASLAKTLRNLMVNGPMYYQGSSDHIATEAFYFGDPEGNGVELYFDKPREDWKYDSSGKPLMGSTYIDEMEYIEKYKDSEEDSNLIKMGHVHLKVGDIAKAKEFYSDTLLFDIINQMPNALFVSRDNYHHHLGMNTWESLGSSARKDGFTGLKSFEILYYDHLILNNVLDNLKTKNINYSELDRNTFTTFDPWGNKIVMKKS